MFHTFRRIALSTLTAAALSATLITPAAAQTAKPLKIGLLTDQSGALKEYGLEYTQGFALGLKYATQGTLIAGGRPLSTIIRDDTSKPDVSASQARDLIENQGVELLAGSASSGVEVQLQKIASDYNMILMAGPSASAAITGANFNPETFRVCRSGAQDFIALASVLKSSGVKKVVVLAADYDFGHTGAASAEAAYKPLGLDFAPAVFAPQNTTDFTPYLQQVLASGADALQPIWAGAGSVTLYQQINELGVNKKLTLINAFNSNPIMKAATTPDQIGGIGFIVYHYTLPHTAVNDWLVTNHQKNYNGTFPDLFTECGFATAQAIVAALNTSNGDTSVKGLTPALEGLSFDGPRGSYYIRPSDHQVLLAAYIVKLTNITDPAYKYYSLVKELGAIESAPPCALTGTYAARCQMPMKPPAAMLQAATPAATISATQAATMSATAAATMSATMAATRSQ